MKVCLCCATFNLLSSRYKDERLTRKYVSVVQYVSVNVNSRFIYCIIAKPLMRCVR